MEYNLKNVKENLIGLLNYSKEIHEIKSKVITDYVKSPVIKYSKFGQELSCYQNVRIGEENEDNSWISIERMERSYAPAVPEECSLFLKGVQLNNPKAAPELNRIASYQTSIDEASDLMASGMVLESDSSEFISDTQTLNLEVQLILKLENCPHIDMKFTDWLNNTWAPWAENELKVLDQIAVYKRYFEIHQELKKHNDEFEIVLSQGFVFYKNEDASIAAPLIEHVLESVIDDEQGFKIKFFPKENRRRVITEPFNVSNLAGASQIRQVVNDLLEHFDNQDEVIPLPFNQTYCDQLGSQIAAFLHSNGKYLDSLLKPPENPVNDLIVSKLWMLNIQPKSLLPYIDNIEELKNQIAVIEDSDLSSVCIAFGSAPSDELPYDGDVIELGNNFIGSLSSTTSTKKFVSSTSERNAITEYFFPLPANPEQISIVEMVSKSDAVAVQGPPGTGKSHTIANIVGHYMATGRRVLISAKTSEALAGVREKLPDTLAKLTISILDNDQEGKKQVEEAISFISSEVQTLNTKQAQEDILKLETEILERRKRISSIEAALLKHAETQLNTVNYTNHSLTPQELVKLIKSEPVKSDWFEDVLTLEDCYYPNFDDSIVSRIRDLRLEIGQDLIYGQCVIPDIRTNLDLPEIKRIHEQLQQSLEIKTALSKGKLPEPATSIKNFEKIFQDSKQLFESVSEIVAHTRQHPDWLNFVKYFFDKDTLPEEREELADLLHKAAEWLSQIEKKLVLGINVDDFDWSDQKVKEAIIRSSNEESPFGLLGFFKGNAKAEFEKIRIRGDVPQSLEDWRQIKEFINLVNAFKPLHKRWKSLASYMNFPNIPDSTIGTIHFLKQHRPVLNGTTISFEKWIELLDNVDKLYPWGVKHNELHKLENEFDKLLNAMRQWQSAREFDYAAKVPEYLLEIANSSKGDIFNKLADFANSLGSKTETNVIGDEWSKIRNEMERVTSVQPLITELIKLCEVIASSRAPKWADRLKNECVLSSHDPWTPSNWRNAWEYQRALGFLSSLPSRNKINELSTELSELENDIRKKLNRMIEVRSLLGLKKNLTNKISSALNRFSAAFSKIGKNITGKRSMGHWKEAKDAMSQCYDAIPCWIIPEGKVAEQIPAKLKAFDLVIIDEASQSDITSIPVILRGEKLLIVGDDKQVSPSLVGIKEERIENLMENWLHNHPLKRSFHPINSLYDLVGIMSPGKKVMLREHFRCVEPIISFCSKNFYSEPLVPLRQSTAKERLDPPLIDIYVKDGVKNRDVNIREAEVITEEIEEIVKNPSMSHRTIGVISLLGFKQAALVQQMLFEKLGVETMSHHRIECGDARYFQGQERDIIFLSMVSSPGEAKSQSSKDVQQRYNVAVSRARDRLVLVRSVGLDDLKNSEDLKVKLINHFHQPIEARNQENNKLELCESQFEREVYQRLIEQGYQVEPQVSAGHYLIDFVVYGSNDVKLAIELDGDQYHGPDRFAQDQIRQKQLERVGWKFWRCWASDWYLDKDGCFTELLTKLNEMGITSSSDVLSDVFVRHEIRGQNQSTDELFDELESLKEPGSNETHQSILEKVSNKESVSNYEDHLYEDDLDISLSDSEIIEIGDNVTISFDDEPDKLVEITISEKSDDPVNKIIRQDKPLALALLGLMVGDNFELITNKQRNGVIKIIEKNLM